MQVPVLSKFTLFGLSNCKKKAQFIFGQEKPPRQFRYLTDLWPVQFIAISRFSKFVRSVFPYYLIAFCPSILNGICSTRFIDDISHMLLKTIFTSISFSELISQLLLSECFFSIQEKLVSDCMVISDSVEASSEL